MKNSRPKILRRLRLGIAIATGISFVVLAAINFSRWAALDGWYPWATGSALLGGILLLASEVLTIPMRYARIPVHLLLAFGVLLPLDAIAFFTVMRIPMDIQDYLTFFPPPLLLASWWCLVFLGRKNGASS